MTCVCIVAEGLCAVGFCVWSLLCPNRRLWLESPDARGPVDRSVKGNDLADEQQCGVNRSDGRPWPRGRRASGHVGRIAGQVPDQDVRVNERGQVRDGARRWRVRRRTSSQGVPRLSAGTATAPASSRKSGVLAITARDRSTRKKHFIADVQVQGITNRLRNRDLTLGRDSRAQKPGTPSSSFVALPVGNTALLREVSAAVRGEA
jgi:hypothetical protein